MITIKDILDESVAGAVVDLMEDRRPWLKTHFKDKFDIDASSRDILAAHHGIHPDSDGEGPEHEEAHKKYLELGSDHVVDYVHDKMDPSKNKVHTQWILNQVKKGGLHLEDTHIGDTLNNFEKIKHRLPKENRDINKFKSVADIHDAITPHLEAHKNEEEEKARLKARPESARVVHEDADVGVFHLKDQAAATWHGKGQGWCTAPSSDGYGSHFNSYNDRGHIYGVVDKKEGKRYQFHFETNQTMAPQNRHMTVPDLIDKMPGLKKVQEFKDKSLKFLTKSEIDHKLDSIHTQPLHIQREVALMTEEDYNKLQD